MVGVPPPPPVVPIDNRTGTLTLPVAYFSAMEPVYEPAANPEGCTETVMLRLVVRLPDGEIVNQAEPPFCVDAAAVNAVAAGALTVNTCAAGVAPPAVAAKLRDVGLAVSVTVLARDTVRVTATLSVRRADTMVTVP